MNYKCAGRLDGVLVPGSPPRSSLLPMTCFPGSGMNGCRVGCLFDAEGKHEPFLGNGISNQLLSSRSLSAFCIFLLLLLSGWEGLGVGRGMASGWG